MISSERRHIAVEDFDQLVRAALRDSVRTEQPSARVRFALLRTAAASRSRIARLASVAGRYPAAVWSAVPQGYPFAVPAHSESQARIDLIHSQLLKLRFVV